MLNARVSMFRRALAAHTQRERRSSHALRVTDFASTHSWGDPHCDRRLYEVAGRLAAARPERGVARANCRAAVSARVPALHELPRHADLLDPVPGVPTAGQ